MKNPKRSSPQPSKLADPKLHQRREIVMMITTDDMTLRLKELARQGRQQDCLALMQELGDWQSYGRGELSPILHASYIGDC